MPFLFRFLTKNLFEEAATNETRKDIEQARRFRLAYSQGAYINFHCEHWCTLPKCTLSDTTIRLEDEPCTKFLGSWEKVNPNERKIINKNDVQDSWHEHIPCLAYFFLIVTTMHYVYCQESSVGYIII